MEKRHTLWVHIGIPRTGSSALQKYLALYAGEDLSNNGLCYPDTIGCFNDGMRPEYGRYGNGNVELFVRGYLKNEKDYQLYFGKLIEAIDDNIRNKDVVISDEDIWVKGKDYIEYLKNRYLNVKIIVLLRRQDKRVESGWSQLIYTRPKFRLSLAEMSDELLIGTSIVAFDHTYYGKLLAFENIVGRENIIVSTYEEACKEGLEQWFMKTLGVENPPKPSGEFVNASHSYINTEVMRQLKIRIANFCAFSEEVGTVFKSNKVKNEKNGSYLGPDDRRRIIEHFAEDNRKVAQRYLGRDELFSNDVDYPQVCITEDEIKEIYTEVLEKMLIHMSYKIKYPSLVKYISDGKKIAFFGAGYMGNRVVNDFILPAEIIIDNNIDKKGQIIGGIPVVWSGDIGDWKQYLILITPLDTKSIEEQLSGMGLEKDVDFFNIHELKLW